ncbi:MAG: tetratricopeptide repeat protein [Labilithrix sp.]|nr:tetratricopeptide repeat protein [Labilithrix sp.]
MKVAYALLALALAGCGGPTRGAEYARSLAEARRAHHAGRFEEAANKFDEASKSAKVPRDAIYARYESALTRARAGDVARAAAELRAIGAAKPPNAYSAQAAFKAAELAMTADRAAGLRELEQVAVDFPDSGVAQVAIRRVIKNDDETAGAEAALAHLERLAPRFKDTKIEETVSYERARRLDELGRTEAARDAYLETAAKWPYPFGAFNDDALFRASAMEEKLGHLEQAIAILERLLAQRETSSMMGSYERPRYLPAILHIAEIYEHKLADRAKARETLHRVYSDFTTSTMRDDALWREADLWRKDGDASTACDRLKTLTSTFPDSRYVPCATERCPAIKRPEKSKAPATCHAYITREK